MMTESQAGEHSFNYDFLTFIKDYHFQNIVFGREVKIETMYNKKKKVSENYWHIPYIISRVFRENTDR